ncbi:MAG: hypothetical protein AAB296_09770 [Candidatus Desantisbacteria bacterium]
MDVKEIVEANRKQSVHGRGMGWKVKSRNGWEQCGDEGVVGGEQHAVIGERCGNRKGVRGSTMYGQEGASLADLLLPWVSRNNDAWQHLWKRCCLHTQLLNKTV